MGGKVVVTVRRLHNKMKILLAARKPNVFEFRGCSQTTFTRKVGRWVVQKCPLFVNIYTIENVNTGE